ncbi:GNAT family N-acetyltransferase [Paenibacillus sp. FSL K6-1096]|uniref:GNAT family N-acetyltransferase n=1 Tax=Paenibacillus sp. FSL K6-1096 TaxID=2921460 RepID=UPI0030EC868E
MQEIEKLARFIAACNTESQHCGYAGSTLEDILHDLSDGLAESSYVLYEGDDITGAMILDIYDVGGDLQDIEVWGPYYSVHPKEELRRLFHDLNEVVQASSIRYVHFFISSANLPLYEYVSRHRIEKVRAHHHYSLDTAFGQKGSPSVGLTVLQITDSESKWTGQIMELHDRQFPGAILTNEEIQAEIEDSGDSEYDIYAVLDGDSFLGYLIVRRNERTRVLHLEYICIRPEARDKGAGKQLIQYLAAAYGAQGYTRIELDVSEENEAAIRFYDRNGFSRERVMKHIVIATQVISTL